MKGLLTKKLSAGLSLALAAVMTISTPCAALAYEVPQEINCESLDEAVAALDELVAYLEENGPEALETAYKEAEERGDIAKLEAAAEELRVYAEEAYVYFEENIRPQMEADLVVLQAELEELKAELAVKKAELMAELEKINAEVEETIAEIEAAIAEIERQIDMVVEALEALHQKLQAAVDETAAFVEATIELNAALEELAAIVNGESTTSYEEAFTRIIDAAVAVKEAYDNAENAKDVLATAVRAIKPLMADVDAAIKAHVEEELAAIDAAIAAHVDEKLAEIDAAIKAHVEEKLAEIEAAVTAHVEEKAAQIVEELEAVAEEINTAVTETAEAIVAKIEEVVALADALYLDATTDTYEIGKDSYYVAIGDTSTYAYGLDGAEGYVERFANALGLAENQYVNLCADCECASVCECIEEVEANADVIAKSDIVTVGFTNNTYVEFALTQLRDAAFGKDAVELDWEAFVPAEAVPYVEGLIAEMEASFVESGMDEETAAYLALAVERLAYAYVEYAAELPALVDAIHAINPDTLVVIVGMYNPLEGLVIGEGAEALDLGAYIDMIVDLSDAYGVAYAMLAENTIFVSAQDVVTVAETEGALTLEEVIYEYLFNGAVNLHASEEGHEYIKDQLIAALDLEVGCTAHVPGKNCPSAKFTDMNYAKWYHLHVDYCVENGLIYGTSETTFSPNMDITRGMIVSILYRLSGEKAGSADVEAMTFTDVDPEKYYAKAIAWAQMNGVVYGTSATTFEPEEPITREEMVAILCRYAKHMGYDVSASADLAAYPDADNVKAWAKAPISWAVAEGLFYGAKTSTGVYKINPNGLTTRAEAASFIYRFCMLDAQ